MPRFELFVFLLFSMFSSLSFCAEAIGKAISLEGEIGLLRAEKDVRIKSGEPVFEGDKVTTGKRSNARFLLTDDTIIDLRENSFFIFEKLSGENQGRDAEFSLDFGKVRASVNQKINQQNNYRIKTKATIFAVRGTDFAITADAKDTSRLSVFEGNVLSQTKNSEELVPTGYELVTGSAKVKLTPAQIQSVFESSRTEDVNFYQNIVVGDYRVSRNFGNGTIQFLNKIVVTPTVQIPKDAFKVPGVNQLNASAVSAGILNTVVSDVGVQIQ